MIITGKITIPEEVDMVEENNVPFRLQRDPVRQDRLRRDCGGSTDQSRNIVFYVEGVRHLPVFLIF